MKLEEYTKRNQKLTIYLMQHVDRIKCGNPKHWNNHTTIVLKHKKLCKDGKYRGYKNAVEYCGINLLEKIKNGESVPFSSSEMKDLKEVVKEYKHKLRNLTYGINIRN